MEARRTPRLSLDLLRGFRAAARHLSFTRAAQELFVTQPAISREVRTLEEQIGQALFRRVNRALELTPAGEELYRAADEALRIVDAAATRLAGGMRNLSVTTTVALASAWLVPRLPSFARLHPDIDMRFAASNAMVDLAREQIDIAVRYVPAASSPPSPDKLFDYFQFPVCAPALAKDPARPLRTVADLARHVLLDFETLLYGRLWFDWAQWFEAMNLRGIKGAAWLRFSHYDQVIEAAIKGSGVAIGKLPHLAQHLRDGVLVAPLGAQGLAKPGAFYIEVAPSAPREVASAFVEWLHAEARHDTEQERAPARLSPPAAAEDRRGGRRPRKA